MSVPRLGAFAALVLLNRFWNAARFDLPLKDFRRAALLGLVPMALWGFYFSGGQGQNFTPFKMFVGFFTSLVVGVFEEYAFRGPLLFALRQRLSLFATVVLSSVLFSIYHVQAQPFRCWVAIFLTGVIYANLRFRGLDLGWLAVIHGVTDALFFAFPDINPNMFGFYGMVLQAGLLAYAVMTFPWEKLTEAPSNDKPTAANRSQRRPGN
jgi:membrane protease YdiL (CAAX protease family)